MVAHLDVRRLLLLTEVARHGSITGAATALNYTPSAVSQQSAGSKPKRVSRCWSGMRGVSRSPRPVPRCLPGQGRGAALNRRVAPGTLTPGLPQNRA
jgi:hypothetical protein